jgi:hypothetical protein
VISRDAKRKNRPHRRLGPVTAYAKTATAVALLALIVAACTAGGSPANGANGLSGRPATASPGGAAVASRVRPDLVLSTRPGGPDAVDIGRGTVASLLAHKAMSCPDTTQAKGQVAFLHAAWSYRGGMTYLSRLSTGFTLKTAVALPFVTVTLDRQGDGLNGQLGLWTSGLLQGNRIRGYHTTGWVPAGTAGHPLALRLADPFLAVEVWAVNPLTALFSCVAETGFILVRN